MRLQMTMTLRLREGEQAQYALGGHPSDGEAAHPTAALPPLRLASTGWEVVCHDERGWTWGRVTEPDHDAVAAAERQARIEAQDRADAEHAARLSRRIATIRAWFPAAKVRDGDCATPHYTPGWFKLRDGKAILDAAGERASYPRDRLSTWGAVWRLAGDP